MMRRRNGEQIPEEQVFSLRNIKNYTGVILARIAGASLGNTVISMYFTYVFTEFFGIQPSVVSGILMLGIFLDGIDDIGMGAVIDHVITKTGKARHWFLWMAMPVGVLMAAIFYCPKDAPMPFKIIFMIFVYYLFSVATSAVRLPVMTMISLGSDAPKVRAMTGWMASIGHSIGSTLTGIILASLLPRVGGDSLNGYRNIMLILSVITIVMLFSAGLLMTEKRSGEDWQAIHAEQEEKRSIKGKRKHGKGFRLALDMWSIFTNRYWLILQVAKFFGKFISGIQTGALTYFCFLILGSTDLAGGIITVISTALLAGTILGLPLLRFLDGIRIIYLSNILRVVACGVAWLYGGKSYMILMLGLVCGQFCEGLISSVEPGLTARVVDYGEWKNGRRLDGMTFGGSSVLLKITMALSSTLCGYFLAASGYTVGGEITQATIDSISFLFLGLPFILSFLSMVTYFFFDLTEDKVKKMREEIENRTHRHRGKHHGKKDNLVCPPNE